MKMRPSVLAAAFGAAAVLPAPAGAIQNADDVSAGERFRRPNMSIDTETRLPDGGFLVKGVPAEVEIESAGKGKVKATFFQGGVRKGEAQGIIVIGGAPAPVAPKGQGAGPGGRRPGALKLADLGLDANAPYAFVKGAGKVDLTLGNPGATQIVIGLPQPAVAVAPAPVVAPQQKVGLSDPPEPDKQPRRPDSQGDKK